MSDQEQKQTTEAFSREYDVAILGGGLAGLTMALQLKKARPATRILVIEKQQHPVPEAAHKVGESSVEVGAYYLRDVVGMKEHLHTEHLFKFGLRMFFSFEDNRDITRRVEFGQINEAPLHSYQMDRGRLENALGQEVLQRGITFLDGCKVQQIILQTESDIHRLHILRDGSDCEIQARWVVDASGRSSLLKRQLGLAKKVDHNCHAAWFRMSTTIDVGTWSTDPAWLGRIAEGKRRWLSTNHLMGTGYWVWLIPLAPDSTSIGIVTDNRYFPFEEINRFDRAMAFLQKHEPQCAAAVEQHRATLQDFRVMKDYSYSCKQTFSGDRWCLVGEAAVAVDPLYSSGSDLIGIANSLACDLITRELEGENVEELAIGHSQLFLSFAALWLEIYQDQYSLMGNARVMVAKIIWDTAMYWAFPGLLYFHDQIRRIGESPTIMLNMFRCANLLARIQAFFREWHAIDQPQLSDAFAEPYTKFDFLLDLHNGMAAGLGDAELEAQFARTRRLLEQLSGQMVSTVIEELADRTEDETAQQQLQRWQTDPLLNELVEIYQEEQKVNPIDQRWVMLGGQSRERQEVSR
jgi:flavin-dependent dehydrogenase